MEEIYHTSTSSDINHALLFKKKINNNFQKHISVRVQLTIQTVCDKKK